jgi:hypothetical protein
MAFDPDEYLRKKTSQFDPDAYLASRSGGLATENPSSTPTGLPVISDSNEPIGSADPKYGFKIIEPRSNFATEGDYKEFHQKPIFGATPQSYPFTALGMKKTDLSQALHIGLPTAGLALGQAAGATVGAAGSGPLAPLGAMGGAAAGGAVGAATGEASADLIDRLLGVQPRIKDAKEAVGQTLNNLNQGIEMQATDMVANAGLNTLGKVASPFASHAEKEAMRRAFIVKKAADMGIELQPNQIVDSKGMKMLENLFESNPLDRGVW